MDRCVVKQGFLVGDQMGWMMLGEVVDRQIFEKMDVMECALQGEIDGVKRYF